MAPYSRIRRVQIFARDLFNGYIGFDTRFNGKSLFFYTWVGERVVNNHHNTETVCRGDERLVDIKVDGEGNSVREIKDV